MSQSTKEMTKEKLPSMDIAPAKKGPPKFDLRKSNTVKNKDSRRMSNMDALAN